MNDGCFSRRRRGDLGDFGDFGDLRCWNTSSSVTMSLKGDPAKPSSDCGRWRPQPKLRRRTELVTDLRKSPSESLLRYDCFLAERESLWEILRSRGGAASRANSRRSALTGRLLSLDSVDDLLFRNRDSSGRMGAL